MTASRAPGSEAIFRALAPGQLQFEDPADTSSQVTIASAVALVLLRQICAHVTPCYTMLHPTRVTTALRNLS